MNRLTLLLLAALACSPDSASAPLRYLPRAASHATQANPGWGLDRIDQRTLALDNAYTYQATGAGVHVYIIDSGILASHMEFGGRVEPGFDAVYGTDGRNDLCYHGTAVASIVGGATVGVAKGVQLVPVIIGDCAGLESDAQLIAGINWVAMHAIHPAVANISFGALPYTSAANDATTALIASGVTVTVAAMNDGIDACTEFPGSTPNAITVASTNSGDSLLLGSNYGPCVDIVAPGWLVNAAGGYTSAPLTDSVSIFPFGGTSAAAPYVAGAAALYLETHPTATPAEVWSYLQTVATPNALDLIGRPNTVNLLLYTGSDTVTPPPPPPDASFGKACSGLTCTFTAVSSGSWTFGDGGTANGQVVSHTFVKKKTYTVTHYVGAASFSRTVTCNPNHCQ